MAAVTYGVATGADVISGTSLISVLGVKAHANSGLQVVEYGVYTKGVVASGVPILVQLGRVTNWGSNSPGTASTSVTPVQRAGLIIAAGFTAAHTWTAEPTTVEVIDEFELAPDKGSETRPFPLGQEPDCVPALGFVIRVTAPVSVALRAMMAVQRI